MLDAAKLAALDGLPPGKSLAQFMVEELARERKLETFITSLTDGEIFQLCWDLDFWARPEQVPPEVFEWCIALAGRGFGKTWMGARWVIKKAQQGRTNGALIGQTAADVRDTMILGPSGILALSPPWFMPRYEPSKRRLTWPNGVFAKCYSADKPDSLRGPNTGWVWGDEPASWAHSMAAIDQIPMFNRIGTDENPPQVLLTGTPRPSKKLEELLKRPGAVLIRGNSLANSANLAPSTVRDFRSRMNTRFGRQEIGGELLLDVPGAIFGSAKWGRVQVADDAERLAFARTLDRVVVGVDPAPTSESGADDTGIVVVGRKELNGLRHAFPLEDLSGQLTANDWGVRVVKAAVKYGADIVAEVNTGGEMVETLIRKVAEEMGVEVNVITVRARESKSKRAEPIASLAETGRIAFVGPVLERDDDTGAPYVPPKTFPKLEKQLDKFTGINGHRDDRADAMCWAIHELVFKDQFFCIV